MRTDAATTELLFEIRNVSKRFGPYYALRDVSMDIRSGQVHAVTGKMAREKARS